MPFSLSEVHFCLTNGWSWVFYILREEHDVEGNTLSCYQSIIWHLKLGDLTDDADLGVADLMVIICEWVSLFIALLIYISKKMSIFLAKTLSNWSL